MNLNEICDRSLFVVAKKAMTRLFVLAFFMLFLVACYHAHHVPGTAPVYYSDGRAVSLLPTAAMTHGIDMPQRIEGKFQKSDGSSDSFEADSWVRANDSVLSITLFTGFGTTLGEITYARDSVKAESSVMNVAKFKTEYLIADFQICFYPFEALQKNFEQAGFAFTENRSGAGNADFVRTLSENGKVILTATKKGSELHLVNELRHYSYHITLGEEN